MLWRQVYSHQGQEEKFLNGDPQLPILNWNSCEDDKELFSILLSLSSDSVEKVPLRCQQNASFLIDARSLKF